MHIDNNKNAKLNGSLTSVLNLITDKAPTRPSDNAKDVLITAIREATLIVTTNKVFPKEILDENVVENCQYKNLKYKPAQSANRSILILSKKVNCTEAFASALSNID